MALCGAVEDVRNEIRTIHYLITGAGRYGTAQPSWKDRQRSLRDGTDGPSPFDVDMDL
jgi:hypothetical protein